MKHLENLGKFPLVYFEKPKDLQGCVSAFPLLSNVYACRERCALALGLKREQSGMELSLEYARRLASPLPPVRIEPSQAPVKEVAARGEECDLRNFPIVRHHEMDPAPYIDMTPVMKHPEEGFYNIAFLRTMYKGPRKLGNPHVPAAQLANFSPVRIAETAHSRSDRRQPPPRLLSGSVERGGLREG